MLQYTDQLQLQRRVRDNFRHCSSVCGTICMALLSSIVAWEKWTFFSAQLGNLVSSDTNE